MFAHDRGGSVVTDRDASCEFTKRSDAAAGKEKDGASNQQWDFKEGERDRTYLMTFAMCSLAFLTLVEKASTITLSYAISS
jgi:hypothetical protein